MVLAAVESRAITRRPSFFVPARRPRVGMTFTPGAARRQIALAFTKDRRG
jgi:hypothetical protein